MVTKAKNCPELSCIFVLCAKQEVILGVFHLPKNSGNSGWDVNGTRLFGSSHWKISGKNGTSEKVVLFSRWKLPNGNLCFIHRISRLYHQFHAFRGLFKRPGFPGLPRVSKKWRLIRVRFLEAFCKETSGLIRVLCLPRSSARSRKFIAAPIFPI